MCLAEVSFFFTVSIMSKLLFAAHALSHQLQAVIESVVNPLSSHWAWCFTSRFDLLNLVPSTDSSHTVISECNIACCRDSF